MLVTRSTYGMLGDTDHYLVCARVRIRISTDKSNQTKLTPKWNIDELQNWTKQQKYRAKVKKTLNFKTEGSESEIEKLWDVTAEIITKTAESVFGKSKR